MGLIGTVNNAINIYIDNNGFIKAERGLLYKAETDSAGDVVRSAVLKSNEPVKTGEWTKIAVTYDCNVMKLYINNELHDQVEGSPNFEHFSMNYMSVGCGLQFLVVPVNNYTGDIRDIRMTGRALPEYELL